ncbi:MAG: hypothetical protein L6V84_04405 [Oscillospiraceae bacterium]|nr:MAG: hypothetical protein L6V84_04405 [Oscillospiraceae bacterium]
MRNRKSPPPRANRIGPNRPSGRLLLTGLPIPDGRRRRICRRRGGLYAERPCPCPPLPLGAMGDSLIGSAVILLLGALLLQKWQ